LNSGMPIREAHSISRIDKSVFGLWASIGFQKGTGKISILNYSCSWHLTDK